MKNGKETFCVNCQHFINEGNVWYNQFCGAEEVRFEPKNDPVTGKKAFINFNDFGNEITNETPHPHARRINKGNCK